MTARTPTTDQPNATLPGQPEPRIQRLTIRGLTKRFGDLNALEDFDLDLEGGEFVSLLGPSGCGKTTALNCIAGLLDSDGGDIQVDGESLIGVPSERRRFGMVFQNYALFPHLTVAKNVGFGLQMQRVPKAEIAERVDAILSLVQLGQFRDRYPAQLSGGQQQRVAIARAVVTEPRLMLMDEPLSNLDAKLRLEMRTEIRRLHQDLGLTTIYVTHDQEEALSLSERVVLMERGRIRQAGSPREVYLHPESAYAANFLGARNLIPARVVERSGDSITVTGESGATLVGRPTGNLSAGDEAIIAIRPEHIQVGPEGSGGGPNTMEGAIVTVEFLGYGAELSIQGAISHDLIARTPDTWSQGERVAITLPPERLFVFPAERMEA
jgi:putative spermidine/putrescine transport system ATP-binding protein